MSKLTKGILISLSVLLPITFALSYIYFFQKLIVQNQAPVQNNTDTDTKTEIPKEISITYTKGVDYQPSLPIPLTKLPSNYSSTLTKLKIKTNHKDMVFILRHGGLLVDRQEIKEVDLQNEYQKLDLKGISLNISSQILDIYVQSILNSIDEEFNYSYSSSSKLRTFEKDIYRNNIEVLSKLTYEPKASEYEYKSKIYYEKDVNQLQRYIDILTGILDTLQKESEQYIEYSNVLTILTDIKEGKVAQTQLKSILNNLANVTYSQDYILSTHLNAIKTKNDIVVATSPVIFNEKYIPSISDKNFSEKYDVSPKAQYSGTIRIPVLMYHHISDIPTGASATVQSMYITPKVFEQQLAYLVSMNYKTLSTQEFYDLLLTGKNPSQKSVLLTFDDGTAGQYLNAFPILKKYGLKGTFFVPSQRSAIRSYQMKEMSDAGMNIESHSVSHPNFVKLETSGEVAYQVSGSKSQIQYATGAPVIAIAFPGCMWDSRTTSAMAGAGYKLGFSCGKSIDHYPGHKYVLSRLHVSNELHSFKRILSGRF